jgi:hypothetical protein
VLLLPRLMPCRCTRQGCHRAAGGADGLRLCRSGISITWPTPSQSAHHMTSRPCPRGTALTACCCRRCCRYRLHR